jgi:hypothetical protein
MVGMEIILVLILAVAVVAVLTLQQALALMEQVQTEVMAALLQHPQSLVQPFIILEVVVGAVMVALLV